MQVAGSSPSVPRKKSPQTPNLLQESFFTRWVYNACMRQVVTLSVVLLLAGAMISTASASTDEERAKQLERERTRLEKESDPVDRAKIGIRISEMLMDDVSESIRDGNLDVMEQ